MVFDGGDTFHGTLPVVPSKGEALFPVLIQMRIDAMVGHWNFAYSPQQLKKLAAQFNYPVLDFNVYNEDKTTFLQRHLIRKMSGSKIANIVICAHIIDKTMPRHFSEGLEIADG